MFSYMDRESLFIFAACRFIYGKVPGALEAMIEISRGYTVVDRLFVEEVK